MFDKSLFLAADDRPLEVVPTPEWAQAGLPEVRVRTISGADRDSFEASNLVGEAGNQEVTLENYRAKLLTRCLVDEAGNRLFADGDAGELGLKSAKVLDRLFDVAQRLNGISKADVEAATKN